MNNENASNIKKLLLDATLLEMQYVLNSVPEPLFQTSEEYNKKINGILCGEYKHRTKRLPTKYILIAAIIAAILLFATACVVTLGYIINYKDNEIVVIPEPGGRDHRDTIEEYYTLGYVPEGYQQVEFSPTEDNAYTIWMRGEEALVFSQSAFSDDKIFGFDNDVAYTKASYNGYEIYYSTQHGYVFLDWKYDGYIVSISFPAGIDANEVKKIIQGIIFE